MGRFPYLQEEPLTVTWNKRNDEKGHAVGTLNVLEGSVPIIINSYRMSPLDVFFLGDSIVPLNDYFLQKVYQKPEAFKGLAPKSVQSYYNLFGPGNALQFSPSSEYNHSGSTNNSSTPRPAIKMASVIDNLSFVHPDDAVDILTQVQTNPMLKRAYEKNETVEILEKIAEKAKSWTKLAQLNDLMSSLEVDRQLVYEKQGKYFVKQANSRLSRVWEREISFDEAQSLESTVTGNEKVAEIADLAVEERIVPGQIKKGSFISVHVADNPVFTDFWVTGIEKVSSYADQAVFSVPVLGTSERLVIQQDGTWTKSASLASSSITLEEIGGNNPKIGDFGVFATEKQASHPFEIVGMVKEAGKVSGWRIEGFNGLEKSAFYPIRVESDEILPKDGEKRAYWVPKNAKFIKLAAKNDGLAALSEFEAKIKIEGLNGTEKAAFYLTDRTSSTQEGVYSEKDVDIFEKTSETVIQKTASYASLHSVQRDTGGAFRLHGPEFEKYSKFQSTGNLGLNDAKWAMIHCGCDAASIEKVAGLVPGESLTLQNTVSAPMSVEEFSERVFEKIAGESMKKLSFAKNMVKVAGNFAEKDSVDALLSLNLLRKNNVMEYLDMIPHLKQIMTSLAKLLVASRMGLQRTDPDSIKTAFDGLAEVIAQLEQLASAAKDIKK